MNKRRSFMLAGAIIGIICAASLLIMGLSLISSLDIITFDMVAEILTTEGVIAEFTTDAINSIVKIARIVYVVMGLFVLGLGISGLVLSIKVLKQANANSNKKGCIIALLVISILSGNLVTAAFMITALCLRNITIEPTPAGVESNQ